MKKLNLQNFWQIITKHFQKKAKMKKKKKTQKKTEIPDYEKQYEVESTGISAENASAIEESSWSITESLVSDFSSDNIIEASAAGEAEIAVRTDAFQDNDNQDTDEQTAQDPVLSLSAALSDAMKEFIRAAIEGSAEGQRRASASAGRLPDMLAAEINGLASDIFGDVILEKKGNMYTVIPDYADEAESIAM